MKVKAIVNCNGFGYEHFNEGDERDLPKKIAKVLIGFKYAEPAETKAEEPGVEGAKETPKSPEEPKEKGKENPKE